MNARKLISNYLLLSDMKKEISKAILLNRKNISARNFSISTTFNSHGHVELQESSSMKGEVEGYGRSFLSQQDTGKDENSKDALAINKREPGTLFQCCKLCDLKRPANATTRAFHSVAIHRPKLHLEMSTSFDDIGRAKGGVLLNRYSVAPPSTYANIPHVFEKIKEVANASMVEKVKACYVFEVEGEDVKYHIDLQEGDGQVGEGDVPNKAPGFRPEVKITMGRDNMLRMFNRELAPATAFMTGKLKLSGDLSKALALETILKEAREAAEKKQ